MANPRPACLLYSDVPLDQLPELPEEADKRLTMYSAILLGHSGMECTFPECQASRKPSSTGWALYNMVFNRWSLEYSCPDHGAQRQSTRDDDDRVKSILGDMLYEAAKNLLPIQK